MAEDGTVRVVQALAAEGEVIDHCIVGEPTSANLLGDMVKIGRRGSINAWIAVDGKQGHVAYPHRAANPIPVMVDILSRLQSRVLDEGYTGFQPSNLEVTTVDVGNTATNVIPASAKARINIRFNPAHKGKDLQAWIEAERREAAEGFSGRVEALCKISGEAFLTAPGAFTDVIVAAVGDATGRVPELSTTGGTSDARFIRSLCPVVEFGLVGSTMHAGRRARAGPGDPGPGQHLPGPDRPLFRGLRLMGRTVLASWPFWALASAVFAALTAILAKVGIDGVGSNLATFIRTVVILGFAGLILTVAGEWRAPGSIAPRSWLFLVAVGPGHRGLVALLFRGPEAGRGGQGRAGRQAQRRVRGDHRRRLPGREAVGPELAGRGPDRGGAVLVAVRL